MPFHGDDNPYTLSAKYVDILAQVMAGEVAFYRMTPQDYLLTRHDPLRAWCLAEPGKEYLVFSTAGEPFQLHLAPGEYTANIWIDTKTGKQKPLDTVSVRADETASESTDERRNGTKGADFTPPDTTTDWVLVLRSK